MPLQKIEGKLVDISISTVLDPATAVLKKIVCGTDSGLEGSVDTTTLSTKCGSITSRGAVSWTANGSGVANSTPGANEISIDEVLTLFQDGTPVYFELAYVNDSGILFRSGQGTFSGYTEAHSVDDNVTFDWTLTVDGDINTVPAA